MVLWLNVTHSEYADGARGNNALQFYAFVKDDTSANDTFISPTYNVSSSESSTFVFTDVSNETKSKRVIIYGFLGEANRNSAAVSSN